MTIASFIKKGKSVIDIGTDHAYLPIWLSKKGISGNITATDLNELPLKAARENIEYYDARNISLIKTCGLCGINADDFDYIVIAGMGGELIVKILEDYIKDHILKSELLLCAMTKNEVLRDFLASNGFFVKSEFCAVSKKHVYSVMQVRFDGKKRKLSGLERIIGKTYKQPGQSTSLYISQKIMLLQNRQKGIKEPLKAKQIELLIDKMKTFLI